MPAHAPEPERLPLTWRPLGARLAVIGLGTMLAVVCAFAWFGFDPEIRAKFTLFQRSTLVAIGLLYVAVGYALAKSKVIASDRGMVVVNGYKRRDYEWPEIISIHLPPGAPWATIDLADGTTASLLAIQGSDGQRARLAVKQLRTMIDRPS